jgi:hypothetical protein
MAEVYRCTEESLWRPQVDGLREGCDCPSGWECQAPVQEPYILLVSIGPHVPVCSLYKHAGQVGRQWLLASIRCCQGLSAERNEYVLFTVESHFASKSNVSE